MTLNQKSKTDKNSVSFQAARDVNLIGLSYSEIKEIFYDLLEQNFPKLKEIAKEEVDKRIKYLIQEVFAELDKHIDTIDINKFSSPNIQYEISQLTCNAARYGNTDNFSLLAKLLTRQLDRESTSAQNQMISECLAIIPKLSKLQLFILILHSIVKSIGYSKTNIEVYNEKLNQYNEYFDFLSNPNNTFQVISENIYYLTLIGCLISEPTTPDNIYSYIKNELSIKRTNENLDIIQLLKDKKLNNIKTLLELSRNYTCLSHSLSPIGELISTYLLNGHF